MEAHCPARQAPAEQWGAPVVLVILVSTLNEAPTVVGCVLAGENEEQLEGFHVRRHQSDVRVPSRAGSAPAPLPSGPERVSEPPVMRLGRSWAVGHPAQESWSVR